MHPILQSRRNTVQGLAYDLHAGKFISFELVDQHGGEIRGVAFNSACDKHEHLVSLGNVILVSKASLKPRKPGDVRPIKEEVYSTSSTFDF